jgi:hypothetical protein
MTKQEAIRVLREALEDDGIAGWHLNGDVASWASLLPEVDDALAATATIQPVAAPEKRAPVQGYTPGIPWSLHLEAYDAYRKRYGSQQALIEGGCRGGFGVGELDMFIPGWRDKVSEIGRLKARIAELEAAAPAQAAPDEVRDAALGVVELRDGELPVRGWLPDNAKSRAALRRLADALRTTSTDKGDAA